jgi:DNA-binding CsgD family transcriptional regulator
LIRARSLERRTPADATATLVPPDNAVAVRDLVKTYPGADGRSLIAVDGLSFDVRHGEIFGLLGPNGAGKTTTLEIIEGLKEPSSGRTFVLGLDSQRDRDRVKERIGVQLQAQAYFGLLTLEDVTPHSVIRVPRESLTLGGPEGWVQVFVDEGAPMAALLGKFATALARGQADMGRLPAPYLGRLVDAFERAGLPVLPPPRRGEVAVLGLVAPLTSRELEVLQLLAGGKPNQAIAEELVVALEAVKSHVAHILDKPGVDNRTEAVVRAQELGLLR